jgi:4-amino-4-deoxychorismate lyase
MYVAARARAGIESLSEKAEVVLWNPEREAMEGSLASLYFWRHEKWITPAGSSGGQMGTTRRWLLEKGLCEEDVVGVDTLEQGEDCWISNGVRGLVWGKVSLKGRD